VKKEMDRLYGGRGNDVLIGGSGKDTVAGGGWRRHIHMWNR